MSSKVVCQPIEPCLIDSLPAAQAQHRDPEITAAEQELAEVRHLGPCANPECSGTIHATTRVYGGRVQREQYCTKEGCDGRIPTRFGKLPDLSPPNYLDGNASGNDRGPCVLELTFQAGNLPE